MNEFADYNFGSIGLKYDQISLQILSIAIVIWLYLLISTSTSLYLCIVNDALRVPYLFGTPYIFVKYVNKQKSFKTLKCNTM